MAEPVNSAMIWNWTRHDFLVKEILRIEQRLHDKARYAGPNSISEEEKDMQQRILSEELNTIDERIERLDSLLFDARSLMPWV